MKCATNGQISSSSSTPAEAMAQNKLVTMRTALQFQKKLVESKVGYGYPAMEFRPPYF
jgi:hypothetical protein